jgi:hypothetical protein
MYACSHRGKLQWMVFLLISSSSGAVGLLYSRAIHELLGQSQSVGASVSLGILVLQSPRPELIEADQARTDLVSQLNAIDITY